MNSYHSSQASRWATTTVLSMIVCTAGLFVRAAEATPAKPNIILVMPDDVGY